MHAATIRDERSLKAQRCLEIEANSFFGPWLLHLYGELQQRRTLPAFRRFPLKTMAQCNSKVFFPDDPAQQPQFNDCPRRAVTARRTAHSVMRLCSTCARVWDEQDARTLLRSNRPRHQAQTQTAKRVFPKARTSRSGVSAGEHEHQVSKEKGNDNRRHHRVLPPRLSRCYLRRKGMKYINDHTGDPASRDSWP